MNGLFSSLLFRRGAKKLPPTGGKALWINPDTGLLTEVAPDGSLLVPVLATRGTDGTLTVASDLALTGDVDISGDTSVDALDVGGDLTLSDTVWDDLRVSVNAVKDISGREPAWEALLGSAIALPAFTDESNANNEKAVTFTVQLPHSYKHGTDLEPHVHWIAEDTTAGNVYWRLDYSWANISAGFANTTDVYKAGANDAVTSMHHNMTSFAALSGTGKTASSMLCCTLRRASANALDTLNSKKAYLLEIDFHFQIDKLGSDDEIPA